MIMLSFSLAMLYLKKKFGIITISHPITYFGYRCHLSISLTQGDLHLVVSFKIAQIFFRRILCPVGSPRG
jgi:hypothetical protein